MKDDQHTKRGAQSAVDELEMKPMGIEDLDEVIEIEKSSFPTPWTLGIFMREFELEFSHRYVFDLAGGVAGYIVFWLIEGEVHIMSVAVRRDLRRLGIGTEVLKRSLEKAKEIGGRYVFLEVREYNDAGVGLYRKMGFRVVYKRRGYYTDTKEDALIMVRDI
ncbi:MAG: ribosomal protein S18-alanine N-acetyltransferase [Deltaproteobacteria bacterium]|nr:ribosomal protein S18-alanine N-acetyltransferase [Candidatus Zymogenaceae bacterium]